MNEGHFAWIALSWISCAAIGCGAKAEGDASKLTNGGATSGDAGSADSSTGAQVSRWCPVEKSTEAPPLADGCTTRGAALDLLCQSDSCPVEMALDLDCQTELAQPRITANENSTWVIVQTRGDSISSQLMTVKPFDSHVEQLAAPLPSDALAAVANGDLWVFGASTSEISTLHQFTAGWLGTTLNIGSPRSPATVTSAAMLEDKIGYFTYLLNGIEPHLATWDGTCWTDAKLGAGADEHLVVKADVKDRPSVAWEVIETEGYVLGSRSIAVRNPQLGLSDELIALPPVPYGYWDYESPPLRLMPGGLDGAAVFPTVALKQWDGVSIFTYDPSVDDHWVKQVLLDSTPAVVTGNCPEVVNYAAAACYVQTTCSEQVSGTGTDFDVVRTQSGAWFAAWLEYVSDATYDLEPYYIGGEMGITDCLRLETSGAGTTDLVLARLTNSKPVLNRVRLYEGDVQSTKDGVALAARGDTLLVAAIMNRGGNTPVLRYLEIDSKPLQ